MREPTTFDDKTKNRFADKILKYGGDGCWEWLGTRKGGYGLVVIKGQRYRAHRIAWVMAHGEIPDGLFVCHACDNPICVRPSHLWLGTNQQNFEDMFKKGRHSNSKYHPAKPPTAEYFQIDL